MVYDLTKRFTPLQVLQHKYFHDLTSPKYSHLVSKLPNLLEFNRLRTPKNGKDILELQKTYILSKLPNKMIRKSTECDKIETNDSTPQYSL
jgi:hypothetical protein